MIALSWQICIVFYELQSKQIIQKKFCLAGKEKIQGGEPFDVPWVKFEFDDGMWDDEVMWDIRYLLMGSKLDKLWGFPLELKDIREKLYISRDGISERTYY